MGTLRLDTDTETGQRLLPVLVDELSRDEPQRPFISVPISSDLEVGFKDISYGVLARAANRCAWWMESSFGRSVVFRTIYASLESYDVRHAILILAAVKTGHKMFFCSSSNRLEHSLHLLDSLQCDICLVSQPASSVLLDILSNRQMQNVDLPDLMYWLEEGDVRAYPFSLSFSEAQYNPLVVLHSSGSTGNPKPLTWTHGLLAATDVFKLIPSLGGRPCLGPHWKGKRVLTLFPWFHGCGLVFYLPAAIYNSFTPVLPPCGSAASADILHSALLHGAVNAAFLAPSTLIELTKNKQNVQSLECLEHITYSGGILPQDVGEMLSQKTRLMGCWGSTEAGFLPIEVPDAEDWAYYKFSPFLGSELRHYRDELYENVIVRSLVLQSFQGVFYTFPEMQEYSTRDLYQKHPTKKGLWLPCGRTDDVITFTDARKLNPTLMESTIESHPSIASALICGQGMPQPALLLQPTVGLRTEQSRQEFINEIWPFIQRVNQGSPLTGQLVKALILPTFPDKPMARAAGKDTILRKRTIDSYEAEINRLFRDAAESDLTANDAAMQESPMVEADLLRPLQDEFSQLQVKVTSMLERIDILAQNTPGAQPIHTLADKQDPESTEKATFGLGPQAESIFNKSTGANVGFTIPPSHGLTAQPSRLDPMHPLSDNDDLWRLVFAHAGQAALRAAFELRVFEAFEGVEESTSEDISAHTGVDRQLIVRIMRAIITMGVFQESGAEKYRHNSLSLKFVHPVLRTMASGLSGNTSLLLPHLPDYLSHIKSLAPGDAPPSLMQYVYKTDLSFFQWIQTKPKAFERFSSSMAADTQFNRASIQACISQLFPENKEIDTRATLPGDEQVLLVDVGGGRGQILNSLRTQRPDLRGRLIVQDLPQEIQGREPAEGVEAMSHDFFTPQPIQGARVYYFRHIFHDWPDAACRQILLNTLPAMAAAGHSRLVIVDNVLPDMGAGVLPAMRDIAMMVLGGCERTESQWRALLEGVGLYIVRVVVSAGAARNQTGVVEAVRKLDANACCM